MDAVPSGLGCLLLGTEASVLLLCPGWWKTTGHQQKPCQSVVGVGFPFP